MWLNACPEGSTVSRLDTFRQVQKSTGRTPKELDGPKLSSLHDNAWQAYTDLTEYTYSELDSYSRLTGNELEPWEVEAVMALAKYRGAEPRWPLTKH
jgi:hypothetical protein